VGRIGLKLFAYSPFTRRILMLWSNLAEYFSIFATVRSVNPHIFCP
jgi:hypothetical protein